MQIKVVQKEYFEGSSLPKPHTPQPVKHIDDLEDFTKKQGMSHSHQMRRVNKKAMTANDGERGVRGSDYRTIQLTEDMFQVRSFLKI
jgi:hypothetical protein